jgi:hypothetical protein
MNAADRPSGSDLEEWRNSPESLRQRLANCERALAESLQLNLDLLSRLSGSDLSHGSHSNLPLERHGDHALHG